MSKSTDAIVIKKYANRRLYNTGTSTYVTLEDLAVMVKAEEDFVVVDAKTGEDITRSVLTQIIFEQESKGQNLLPVNFLRNLIQIYGDSVQTIMPSYLEHSMDAFRKQQDKFREQITTSFGPNQALDMIGDQTRRNTELFQNAMRLFMPFGPKGSVAQSEGRTPQASNSDDSGAKRASHSAGDDELSAMKKQLADMQAQLKSLNDKK
ncbi:MAG: polyhydroxyalkanoate synthesis repressor PhaR [Rhizobiales bacterium]|nr:polyhydroxyalkanoate synthesis repressor PhaR [Hyphomicrobiales bacterium]